MRAYGSDRIRPLDDGAVVLSCRLPKAGWTARVEKTLTRSEHPGTAILWDDAYYEVVELCARLHDSGWQTRMLPLAKATHRGSQSSARVNAQYLRTRNRYFVARLHHGVGRISALIVEDLKLLLRGRSSLRGMIEGLCSKLS